MAYKDKEKQREYQRNWVRQKRGSTRVRQPESSTLVIPTCEQIVGVLHKRILANPKVEIKPKPQSHNSMMVGYVPPIPKE